MIALPIYMCPCIHIYIRIWVGYSVYTHWGSDRWYICLPIWIPPQWDGRPSHLHLRPWQTAQVVLQGYLQDSIMVPTTNQGISPGASVCVWNVNPNSPWSMYATLIHMACGGQKYACVSSLWIGDQFYIYITATALSLGHRSPPGHPPRLFIHTHA